MNTFELLLNGFYFILVLLVFWIVYFIAEDCVKTARNNKKYGFKRIYFNADKVYEHNQHIPCPICKQSLCSTDDGLYCSNDFCLGFDVTLIAYGDIWGRSYIEVQNEY